MKWESFRNDNLWEDDKSSKHNLNEQRRTYNNTNNVRWLGPITSPGSLVHVVDQVSKGRPIDDGGSCNLLIGIPPFWWFNGPVLW